MFSYSIMPVEVTKPDEVCRDIINQYDTGVADCALLCMTLVPEGNPPIDKAGMYCEVFDDLKKRLGDRPLGILVQASIGHGYKLNAANPFQRYVSLNSGEETYTVCPYDEGFRKHIKSVMSVLTKHKPEVIMVDDDFRLIHRAGKGCACPLHMAAFNKKAGTNMTREELWKHTQGRSEEDRRYTAIFVETQKESLLGAAQAMREGIDSVDPKMQGIYCCCGGEFGGEIAKVLAGKGNPVVVRVNNGMYTAAGARNLSGSMYRAAAQIASMGDGIDAYLAETDTCPQNRYSTAAQSLNAHYAGTILEGASGAKHWITRLHAYEPDSGVAYRKKLAKYHGLHEKLMQIVPTLKWLGCRIPVTSTPLFGFAGTPDLGQTNGWLGCVLERLGLPLYFSSQNTGAAFLDGPVDERYTNDELIDMLKGPVFLASDTAQNLVNRGLKEYLGVDVKNWNGLPTSGEDMYVNGNHISAQVGVKELIPLNDRVKADSMVYHLPDGKTHVPLFPGATIYKNELGGTAFVFSGTPQAKFNYQEAFSFLCETRKKQIVNMLKSVNCLPVYYPGDADMYMKAADMPDGSLFVAMFDLCLDKIEDVELVIERSVTKIERLMPDGSTKEIAFTKDGNKYTLATDAETLEPVILFVR